METIRTIIKPLSVEDKICLKSVFLNSNVRKYLGGVITEIEFNSKFENMLNDHESMYWVARLKEDNSFVGLVSIDTHHNGTDREISYQLAENMQGLGLGFEVVSKIIQFAFDKIKLKKLVAETQLENKFSIKMLQKIGMTLESELERFGEKQVVYKINVEDYN